MPAGLVLAHAETSDQYFGRPETEHPLCMLDVSLAFIPKGFFIQNAVLVKSFATLCDQESALLSSRMCKVPRAPSIGPHST